MRPLVFGSAATDFGMARDIDILLVYPAGDVLRAHETAALLRNQSPDFDVLALSVEELEGVAFAEPEHDLRALPIEWHW
jgi:predicted nucleotidyltransferase